jgi:hypothetical protein
MDEDLPQRIESMSIGSPIHPGNRDAVGPRPGPRPTPAHPQTGTEQRGYIAPIGFGGVSTSRSTPYSDPAVATGSPVPTPLIPNQPLPPGAPPLLAAAMSPVGAEFTTGSPCLDGSGQHGAATSPVPGSGRPVGPTAHATPEEKVRGRPHPLKPVTPAQIAEFAALWANPEFTVAQIARTYRAGEQTIRDWRRDFRLPPRPETLARAAKAEAIMGAAMAKADPALNGQVVGTPPDPNLMDPMKDQEIVDALNDLRSEARIMTAHSDLGVLQRKLSRISLLVATKAPLRSWGSLQTAMDAHSRAVLRARQVEASIPRGDADPVMLRKEAAGQLMQELKSVLTPEEQSVLARLVKLGADRLVARGGGGMSEMTNDLPGIPPPAHNGKVPPYSSPPS